MIRVRSGKYKNRIIKEANKDITRPTKDIVKLGLFNIINYRINNSIFLDLFSGTGQIGIEALSRGSKKVYFNELNKDTLKILKDNLLFIESKSLYELYSYDYHHLIEKLNDDNIKFDIIFIDPPYNMNIDLDLINKLLILLNDKGFLIFEREDDSLNLIDDSIKFKEYKYGRSKLFVYLNNKL